MTEQCPKRFIKKVKYRCDLSKGHEGLCHVDDKNPKSLLSNTIRDMRYPAEEV